jgi:hypothetical protein
MSAKPKIIEPINASFDEAVGAFVKDSKLRKKKIRIDLREHIKIQEELIEAFKKRKKSGKKADKNE